jgi:hypothetical protein
VLHPTSDTEQEMMGSKKNAASRPRRRHSD